MANPSKGLGRGLAALLGDDVMTPEEEKTSLYLPISQVESCASQPRKQFDPDALADLADSIRVHGIIQPLTVRKLQSGYYQIIAGERRWRAARMAGLTQVPAVVIEADDRKAMELAMIENLQREDLNPIEEAEGYRVLSACNGKEALAAAAREDVHLILMDIMMPVMDGLSAMAQLRQTSNVPVILLTAKGEDTDKVLGLNVGADDYITKPFNTNLLISRCNNLVNSRILLQEKFSKQPQAFVQMLATNPIDKEILDRAMAVIEQHLDDTEFNVNVFAREMAMARTNLFTKLKAITGQTPNDFILTIRLKKGALMLRNNPELNITEIADRIGFSSSRYFSKCFKDIYHVSPLAYRKGENGGEESTEDSEETS